MAEAVGQKTYPQNNQKYNLGILGSKIVLNGAKKKPASSTEEKSTSYCSPPRSQYHRGSGTDIITHWCWCATQKKNTNIPRMLEKLSTLPKKILFTLQENVPFDDPQKRQKKFKNFGLRGEILSASKIFQPKLKIASG